MATPLRRRHPPYRGADHLELLGGARGVCTVDPSTGALTLAGVGECVITATAASSDDYNQGTATYTVTVRRRARWC